MSMQRDKRGGRVQRWKPSNDALVYVFALSLNGLWKKPVPCYPRLRSAASFQGSQSIQDRCNFGLHLIRVAINGRMEIWEKNRRQNILFE